MKRQLARISIVRIRDLASFASKALAGPAFKGVMPISPARALSQSRNPYASAEDPALLVAFADGRCVGYFGLVPGKLANADRFFKIYFASTFFIAPEYRNRGIGALILKELKNLNIDVVLTGMTKSAKRTYDSAGFKELGNLTYYQLRLEKLHVLTFPGETSEQGPAAGCRESSPVWKISFLIRSLTTRLVTGNAHAGTVQSGLLIPSHEKTRLGRMLLWADDWLYRCLKKLFYRLNLSPITDRQSAYHFKRTARIDAKRFSTRASAAPVAFYRGAEALNWMLEYPWIVSSGPESFKMANYFFTSVRDFFKYIVFEIFTAKSKQAIGFAIFSISSRKSRTLIKLLDYYLPQAADIQVIGKLLITCARKFQADTVEYPAALAPCFMRHRSLRPFIKKRRRLYMIHTRTGRSPLAAGAGDIVLNHCDSDIAFV